MERFVCVRVVRASKMDISLFQYNWWSTWAVFYLNADRTIYGRYGRADDNTLAGLKKSLEGALDLHKNYPANKRELAGKTGVPFEWKTPEDVPAVSEKQEYQKDQRPGGGQCIHCHHVLDGIIGSLHDLDRPIPERFLAEYPTPERMGVSLHRDERATVTAVKADSPAAKAGFRVGDKILRLAGQPILSIADVEWVLYAADDVATLEAEIERDGKKPKMTITLPKGWRSR